ncbi:hypothetical protein [Sinobaca sp. H24]|uniref:hypothetical protein n=1 Tax=Sinobaca sp. H24 TaxID=2923376 RepID=UPI00207926DD|nr:hypothetical protein [Sinobaca sp. H24]
MSAKVIMQPALIITLLAFVFSFMTFVFSPSYLMVALIVLFTVISIVRGRKDYLIALHFTDLVKECIKEKERENIQD